MKLLLENWRKYIGGNKLSKQSIKKALSLIKEETKDTYGSEVSDAAADSRKKGMRDLELTEEDDRCTRIAKRKYDVWPSAYASGAVVKCRQGKIWKDLKEQEEKGLEIKIRKALRDEGGAAGMDALVKHTDASEKEIKDTIEDMDDVGRHEDGDYILDDSEDIEVLSEKEGLKKWFDRKGAPGKTGGWVDCNTCRKGKCKPCGRSEGERRKKPRCRPTPSQCKGYKRPDQREGKDMYLTKENLIKIIQEEIENVCYETLQEQEILEEAEYQGRQVTLNKPFRTPDGPKKSSVYVKNDKGNVVKVNFGDPNMEIKRDNPARRRSFRARHKCKTPGPKWKARYWSCKAW